MTRRDAIANTLLVAGSVVLTLLLLELVVFRYVLRTNGQLPFVSRDNVVRFVPGAEARYYNADGTIGDVSVNADGWVSSKPHYAVEKVPGRTRIAVVGDSYVQAVTVGTAHAFPELVEQRLLAAGRQVEVYRFGMGGAPLSQYLHMLRHEVLRFAPDIVVVLLIHNDFDEIGRQVHGRLGEAFLRVMPDAGGELREVAPRHYVPHPIASRAERLHMVRYLYYQTGLASRLRRIAGGDKAAESGDVSSAVEVRFLDRPDELSRATRYVLAQMQSLAAQKGIELRFVMDGVRDAIYAGEPRDKLRVAILNDMSSRLTRELGLPFLDLQAAFAEHWSRHRRRFEYTNDWHWNRLGHEVAGEAIARWLLSESPRLGAR